MVNEEFQRRTDMRAEEIRARYVRPDPLAPTDATDDSEFESFTAGLEAETDQQAKAA